MTESDGPYTRAGSPTIRAGGAPEVLHRAREVIAPAMSEAVDRLHADIKRVTTYHLGWTDVGGQPIEGAEGKGIRPALAVLSAEAVWADAAVAVPGGVAVELVHNFSLIHDDIIDHDESRHHRPTVWSVYGVGMAIIAGDALQVLAHQVLLEASPQAGPAASAALAEATASMIAGQADDLAFEQQPTVSVQACTAMSAAKTGALLGCASSIGAVLAGAAPATVAALRDYGRHLGLAFQAVDDLLGIWGDPALTGKPVGSDLRQRKKSLPVVAALAAGGDDADELRSLVVADAALGLPAPPLDPEQVDRAAYLVEACGGRAWAVTQAKTHLDAALGCLERTSLCPRPRRQLADLAMFVLERRW